jgi:hypothetical protein
MSIKLCDLIFHNTDNNIILTLYLSLLLYLVYILPCTVADANAIQNYPGTYYQNALYNKTIVNRSTSILPPSILTFNPFGEKDHRLVLMDKNLTVMEDLSYNNKTSRSSLFSALFPHADAPFPNQQTDLSPWFPSVPAQYCNGIFKLMIEGKLDLGKDNNLNSTGVHKFTFEIKSQNNPMSNTVDRNSILGTLLINNTNPDVSGRGYNFDINKVYNSCKSAIYTS